MERRRVYVLTCSSVSFLRIRPCISSDLCLLEAHQGVDHASAAEGKRQVHHNKSERPL